MLELSVAKNYIAPTATVTGVVTLGQSVFIGPGASVRGDEGKPIYIGNQVNIQDNVVIHALEHGRVTVNNELYAVYIDDCVSCAHASVVHGPVYLGSGSLIGFGAVLFDAIVGANCVIWHNAVVTGGVTLPDNCFVPAGKVIECQDDVRYLGQVPDNLSSLAKEVVRININLITEYSRD